MQIITFSFHVSTVHRRELLFTTSVICWNKENKYLHIVYIVFEGHRTRHQHHLASQKGCYWYCAYWSADMFQLRLPEKQSQLLTSISWCSLYFVFTSSYMFSSSYRNSKYCSIQLNDKLRVIKCGDQECCFSWIMLPYTVRKTSLLLRQSEIKLYCLMPLIPVRWTL